MEENAYTPAWEKRSSRWTGVRLVSPAVLFRVSGLLSFLSAFSRIFGLDAENYVQHPRELLRAAE